MLRVINLLQYSFHDQDSVPAEILAQIFDKEQKNISAEPHLASKENVSLARSEARTRHQNFLALDWRPRERIDELVAVSARGKRLRSLSRNTSS